MLRVETRIKEILRNYLCQVTIGIEVDPIILIFMIKKLWMSKISVIKQLEEWLVWIPEMIILTQRVLSLLTILWETVVLSVIMFTKCNHLILIKLSKQRWLLTKDKLLNLMEGEDQELKDYKRVQVQ